MFIVEPPKHVDNNFVQFLVAQLKLEMLTQLDQNTNMDNSRKHQLYIHHTNLFQPHKLGISAISQDPSQMFLAITRKYLEYKEIGHPFTQIEIYDTYSNNFPKHVQTIIEYEDITGIEWISGKHILTVTLEATINIYYSINGTKVKTMTTDFGPIKCMRYDRAQRLLITGTEYGYVACYRLGTKGKSIELISKLVKINDPIKSVDFHVVKRSVARKKAPSALPIVIPGKRKRSESSDEESDNDDKDDDNTETFEEYLESNDITIYGTSASNIVCWDFHKKIIVETIVVGNETTSLIVLNNGDVAVGDVEGHLGIFDQKSFTCRQASKVLDKGILHLAKSSGHDSTIMVVGQEPTIALLKPDKMSELRDEYVFFEKLRDHTADVTCGLFQSKKTFYTCSADGSIIKFRMSHHKKRNVLRRYACTPDFTNRIRFAPGSELMINQGKSLTIYKLVESIDFRAAVSQNYSTHQYLKDPQKICTLRVGSFIHSADIDKKWICYATRKRVSIHRRSNVQQVESVDDKLPNCHILQICCDGQLLVAGQQKKLYIIRLLEGVDSHQTEFTNQSESTLQIKHKIIFAFKTKGFIKQIVYLKGLNQLLVTCAAPKNFIYNFRIPQPNDMDSVKIEFLSRIQLQYSPLFIQPYNETQNDAASPNLYIYTSRDQLIRIDGSQKGTLMEAISDDSIAKREPIEGLPEDANILGLLIISRDHCIIYDKNRMFKIDVGANKIINETSNYNHVTIMDKSTFESHDELLVVSTLS